MSTDSSRKYGQAVIRRSLSRNNSLALIIGGNCRSDKHLGLQLNQRGTPRLSYDCWHWRTSEERDCADSVAACGPRFERRGKSPGGRLRRRDIVRDGKRELGRARGGAGRRSGNCRNLYRGPHWPWLGSGGRWNAEPDRLARDAWTTSAS